MLSFVELFECEFCLNFVVTFCNSFGYGCNCALIRCVFLSRVDSRDVGFFDLHFSVFHSRRRLCVFSVLFSFLFLFHCEHFGFIHSEIGIRGFSVTNRFCCLCLMSVSEGECIAGLLVTG